MQNLNSPDDLQNVAPKDTAGQNSVSYWTAYLVAAFQGPKAEDNDDDGEPGQEYSGHLLGITSRNAGISVVFMETDHGYARMIGINVANEEQDTVVHELGHLVGQSADEPVSTGSRYVENYLDHIRSTQKPAD